jgi:hypothetical protein
MSSFGGRGGGGGGGAPRVRKVMTQAINLIFEFLKNVSLDCDINVVWMKNIILVFMFAKRHT